MTMFQVPVNDLARQTTSFRQPIEQAIRRVLDRGWFVLGPELEAFEAEFAAYTQIRFCRGVANGTDALELALRAIGIGPGSRVATIAIAGMYSTTAIVACGAVPVFIDIAPDTWSMDLEQLAAENVDAIIATHLYGRMERMPELLQVAGVVPVIEDCAQAHGARLDGRPAGAWGIAGCFSFYPTKNLGALGDGGAVTTSDESIAARIAALRQYGWHSKYHAVTPAGRNSRLDELQAAVLRAKLPRLDHDNQLRRSVAARYNLSNRHTSESDVCHLYVIRSEQRDTVRELLAARQIGTDIHYPVPDYNQPAVTARIGTQRVLPRSEEHCAQILTLPCFPELTDAEVNRIAEAVTETLADLSESKK